MIDATLTLKDTIADNPGTPQHVTEHAWELAKAAGLDVAVLDSNDLAYVVLADQPVVVVHHPDTQSPDTEWTTVYARRAGAIGGPLEVRVGDDGEWVETTHHGMSRVYTRAAQSYVEKLLG